jgi:hypothetical protein
MRYFSDHGYEVIAFDSGRTGGGDIYVEVFLTSMGNKAKVMNTFGRSKIRYYTIASNF